MFYFSFGFDLNVDDIFPFKGELSYVYFQGMTTGSSGRVCAQCPIIAVGRFCACQKHVNLSFVDSRNSAS